MNQPQTHGGKRPGAGRPPREDGRTNQVIVIMATDTEAEIIRRLTTDDRRIALLDEAESRRFLTAIGVYKAKN